MSDGKSKANNKFLYVGFKKKSIGDGKKNEKLSTSKIQLNTSTDKSVKSVKIAGKSTTNSRKEESVSISKYFSHLKKSSGGGDNKTKISHISEKTDLNLKDEFVEGSRTNNLLDKIIHAVGENPKKIKKGLDKVIGIEKNKKGIELKLMEKMDMLDKNFNTFSLTSPKEENQNFELVEKHYLDNLKKDNENLSIQIKNLVDQIKETKITCRKTAAEANLLNQVNDHQNKMKTDNSKKLKKLNEDILENTKHNKQLKDDLTSERMDKDNLYRALINYTKQFDAGFAEELAELYKGLNNQFFLATYRPTDEKTIEELLGKISLIEREIKLKESEISSLNKLLLPEKKKNLIGGSEILPTISSRRGSRLPSNKK